MRRTKFLLLCGCAFLLTPLSAQIPVQPKSTGAPGETFEIQVPPFSVNYPLTEDSKPHPGVPRGIVYKVQLPPSRIFPNTTRKISVYVPAQYKAEKPACVWVFLDGMGFHASTVLDNLIEKRQMPVTIAIAVGSGSVASADSKLPRYDRSFEFDSRTPRLANFLLNEVLPAVEASSTPDGRRVRLSHDPNDRAITGASTGGIGAFNVAWQRPDAFRRVFSVIGTFVGMRGGERLYVQVRKTEPKPIRVFLEDGAYDGWTGGLEMGDWWMSNLTMNRALEYAGYDVRHVWGTGDHNDNQASQIFPDVARWLWRDYPEPIKAQPPNSQAITSILLEDEGWQLVGNCTTGTRLATGRNGEVYAGVSLLNGPCPTASSKAEAVAVAPDGSIVSQDQASALAFSPNGDLYIASGNEIWLQPVSGGAKAKVAETPHPLAALAVTPDGQWLFAAQPDSHLSFSFRIQNNGLLDSGEPYYDLYVPAESDGSGARAVAMDREGRAYVATSLGVQICDHNGRVVAILPLPTNQSADALAFGGQDFTTLYVISAGKLYKRRLKIGGVFPSESPISIPNWGAG